MRGSMALVMHLRDQTYVFHVTDEFIRNIDMSFFLAFLKMCPFAYFHVHVFRGWSEMADSYNLDLRHWLETVLNLEGDC